MKILKKFTLILLLLFLIVLFGGQQSFTVYFVAPNGNDATGDGTMTKPWFTLNKAWQSVDPGEIVYMRGGTYYYNETQILGTKNGTEGNMIKLMPYENEKVIIRPSETFTATRGVYVRGNYIHIKDIEICYFEQVTPTEWYNGITAYSVNYCIFEEINVHHNGFGFSIGGQSTGNLVLNSDFHHNYDPITAITTNRPYGGSDGLTIRVADPNSVNTVRGCRMWNNSDDGFDGWYNAGLLIFDNCWFFNNGYREDGITEGGDGNGLKLGPLVPDPWTGYETEHKRTIQNCVAFNNRMNGFDQNAALCVMYFYNNTAFRNGNHGIVLNNVDYVVITAKNNISYKNTRGQAYFNSVSILDHNTFTYNNGVNPAYSVTDADFVSLDTAGVTSARRPRGDLPVLPFLHLKEGSDLIGTGVSVGIATDGNNRVWDMPPSLGAFEFKVPKRIFSDNKQVVIPQILLNRL